MDVGVDATGAGGFLLAGALPDEVAVCDTDFVEGALEVDGWTASVFELDVDAEGGGGTFFELDAI